jgi:hypothetical protein
MAVINSYKQFGLYMDNILTQNGDAPVGSPHNQFWDTLSYSQFVKGDVPGVTNPDNGTPMKILIVGNSKDSNFVMALEGTKGSVFDPDDGAFGQMPFGGTPFTADQIAPIAAWIDASCPDNP